jgi:malonyl-CoA/methylmalonyl-CoA synthetase
MTSPLLDRLEASLAGARGSIREVESGATRSLASVWHAAGEGALRLRAAGIEPGAHVAVGVMPGVRAFASVLAVWRSGAAVVPLPAGAPAPELARMIDDARVRHAIVDDAFASAVGSAATSLAPIEVEPEPLARTSAPAPWCDALGAESPALILFTSGTTGRPKPAVLTHGNLAAQAEALRAAWGFSPSDTLLHALPLHHLHGLVVAALTALTTPASIATLRKFDAALVVRELPRATVLMTVPTMLHRLVDTLEADGESSVNHARALRLTTSGSAALPASLAERWRAIAGSLPLERYGMTEVGIALSNPLDPGGRRVGFVGGPLPSVEVRIVDDAGRDGDGPGELFVRGPSVFAGYLDRPEATHESFEGSWFRTGDVAARVEDGSVRLLGRRSVDILKTGGEKVSALEIEEALREHPEVAEIAVVGLPDAQWGDRVVAAVVARPDSTLTGEALRTWAKGRLAPYKVPREVRLVPELPRNAMGKVQKPELVRLLASP